MFKKILLALGESGESQEILTAGLTLSEKLGAEILLLHVIQPMSMTGYSPLVGGMFPMVNEVALDRYAKEWHEYEQRGCGEIS
jgi:nucleotide-binding universal stress UspA family protein